MFPIHLLELNTLYFVSSYNKLSPFYNSFVMSLSSHVEPNTYSEAMKHECWKKSINVRYLFWSKIKHGRLFFYPRTKLP